MITLAINTMKYQEIQDRVDTVRNDILCRKAARNVTIRNWQPNGMRGWEGDGSEKLNNAILMWFSYVSFIHIVCFLLYSDDAPTKEELMKNLQIMEMKKINAAKLDQQFGVKPLPNVTGINFPVHDDNDDKDKENKDNNNDQDKIKN